MTRQFRTSCDTWIYFDLTSARELMTGGCKQSWQHFHSRVRSTRPGGTPSCCVLSWSCRRFSCNCVISHIQCGNIEIYIRHCDDTRQNGFTNYIVMNKFTNVLYCLIALWFTIIANAHFSYVFLTIQHESVIQTWLSGQATWKMWNIKGNDSFKDFMTLQCSSNIIFFISLMPYRKIRFTFNSQK